MPKVQALLVIDAQVGLIELLPMEMRMYVLPRISQLISRARASGTPVIYVQHSGPVGHPLEPSKPGWAIDPDLRPGPGEAVVHKRACDAFFETTLQQELSALGVSHLVIAGGMTEYCVDTTCRRAPTLGYDVTLVSDGHLTADNGRLKAAQIIAHHNSLLDGFSAGGHAITVKAADDVTF
jgi:nicotinamidase-related amidase